MDSFLSVFFCGFQVASAPLMFQRSSWMFTVNQRLFEMEKKRREENVAPSSFKLPLSFNPSSRCFAPKTLVKKQRNIDQQQSPGGCFLYFCLHLTGISQKKQKKTNYPNPASFLIIQQLTSKWQQQTCLSHKNMDWHFQKPRKK